MYFLKYSKGHNSWGGVTIMKSKEMNHVNHATLSSITSGLLTNKISQNNKQKHWKRWLHNTLVYRFTGTLKTHHEIQGKYLVFSRIQNNSDVI